MSSQLREVLLHMKLIQTWLVVAGFIRLLWHTGQSGPGTLWPQEQCVHMHRENTIKITKLEQRVRYLLPRMNGLMYHKTSVPRSTACT